jgi:hypothetical protein
MPESTLPRRRRRRPTAVPVPAARVWDPDQAALVLDPDTQRDAPDPDGTLAAVLGADGWDRLAPAAVDALLGCTVVADDRLDPDRTVAALNTRRFLDALEDGADEDDDYAAGGGPEWWETDPADWPAEYELEVAA